MVPFLSLSSCTSTIRFEWARERETIDPKHKIQSMCTVFETTTASISKCITDEDEEKWRKNCDKYIYIWSAARTKEKKSRDSERETRRNVEQHTYTPWHSLIMANFFDDANRSRKFFFHIQSNSQQIEQTLKNDEEATRDWFDSPSLFGL